MQSISSEEYKNLQKPIKRRNQEETNLQKQFGQIIQGYENMRKLSPGLIKWSYIANGEARPAKVSNGKRFSKVGADLKKKGVKKGIFDYFFCLNKQGIAHFIWLESKSTKGQMTLEQKEFKKKIEGLSNMKVYEFRTVEEGLDALRREGILLN